MQVEIVCIGIVFLSPIIVLSFPPSLGDDSTLIDLCLVSDACIVLDSGTMAVIDIINDHRSTYVSIKIDLNLSTFYFR